MYRLLAVLCVSLIFVSPGYGQSRRQLIDSLQQAVANYPVKDTAYARTLDQYSRIIRHDSTDRSFALNREVLAIADGYKNEYLRMEAWYTRTMLFLRQTNNDSALYYADRALPYFKENKKSQQYFTLLNIKGELFLNKADFSKAIDVFQQTIEATQNQEEPALKRQHGVAYGEISSIYWGMDLWEDAIMYGKKSLQVIKEIKDTVLISAISYNLGNCYLGAHYLDTAEVMYKQAIEMADLLKQRPYLRYSPMGGLGLLYGKTGRFDSSIALLKQAVELAKQYADPYIETYYTIGTAQSLLAAAAKQTGYAYREALTYARAGYQQSLQVGDMKTRLFGLEVLSEALEKNGNYREALHYHQLFTATKDSLIGSNKRQEIAIRQIRFDTELAQQLLAQQHADALQKEKTTQRYLLIIASLIVLSLIIFAYLYRRRAAAKAAQSAAQLTADITEAEMKALRSQMNPHFVFNALNSIRYYTATNDSTTANTFLLKYAHLMRQVFENAAFKKISLADDLKALDCYLQVESLRLQHKFDYRFHIPENLPTEEILIPSMLLQPVVENSVWHGITPRGGKGMIKISLEKDGDMLACTVEDNGIGYIPDGETEKAEEKNSGLSITATRIKLLNRQYNNNKASITITSSPEGTLTKILLPFDVNENPAS